MYPSHLGPGDRVDFMEPPEEGPILGYSHRAVASRRRRQKDERPMGERINLYAYGLHNSIIRTDPSGMTVSVCCRATNIPVLGWLGYLHCWLKTDTEAAGRGTVNKCCNSCVCARTQQTDHSNDVATSCREPEEFYNKDRLPGPAIEPGTCDENCINNQLTPGTDVGRFFPFFSDCNTFVVSVLRKCCTIETIPFTAMGGEYGYW
jgi:hypothetical protein